MCTVYGTRVLHCSLGLLSMYLVEVEVEVEVEFKIDCKNENLLQMSMLH